MNYTLLCLQNILQVFRSNGVVAPVTMVSGTILFEGLPFDVPYKQELIDAGATYDIGYGCWTYWSNDE